MRAEYGRIHADPGTDGNNYSDWFGDDLNNAKLMSVSIYRAYLPGFNNLLSAAGGNLVKFYGLVEQLRACTKEQRRVILLSGETSFNC